MKILIVGSKGFIGSNLVNYLQSSYDVYGCDVLVDYNDPKYYQVDATNADYDDIFQGNSFEACVNCSGAASVPDSFVHPQRDFKLNVQHVYAMLDAIRKYSPGCKFINLSSAAVYGNPEGLPITETMEPKPVSPYGMHKWYSEQICREFYAYYKLPTCSVRIFSTFGPGLQKQIFWDWHKKILSKKHIAIWGNGKESRDYIFIDDLVRAIACVMEGADFEGEALNIGNGEEIFIKTIIGTFQRLYPNDFTYEFTNEVRKGDPLNWRADNRRLQKLGYKPLVSFEDGVDRYIKWLFNDIR